MCNDSLMCSRNFNILEKDDLKTRTGSMDTLCLLRAGFVSAWVCGNASINIRVFYIWKISMKKIYLPWGWWEWVHTYKRNYDKKKTNKKPAKASQTLYDEFCLQILYILIISHYYSLHLSSEKFRDRVIIWQIINPVVESRIAHWDQNPTHKWDNYSYKE